MELTKEDIKAVKLFCKRFDYDFKHTIMLLEEDAITMQSILNTAIFDTLVPKEKQS